MPNGLMRESRYDFRGGMSRQRRQTLQQCYLSQNMRSMPDGVLKTRKGRLTYGTLGTSGSILSLLGRYTTLLGEKVYSIQSTVNNDVIYDNTTELTGLNLNLGSFASIGEYKDIIFFSNGIAPVQYHVPGTSVRASITGSPTPSVGSYMLFYKDRCYIGKDDGDVAYSDLGMFSTLPTCDFPTNNKVTLGSTGDGIKGLAPGQDYLVAFRKKAYHVMTGEPNDDGGLGDMSWQTFEGLGTSSPRSITFDGKRIAFLGSNNRPLMLEGSTTPIDLDENDNVKEYFDALTPGSIEYVCSEFYGNELWIALPQGPDKNTIRILVRNMTSGSWTIFTNHNISFLYYAAQPLNKLYGGDINGSNIYELESSYSDGDSKIPIDYISRGEVLGNFESEKIYKTIYVQTDTWTGETLTLAYGLNNTTSFTNMETGNSIAPTSLPWADTVWGAAQWGGITFDHNIAHPIANTNARGYELRIRISGNVSGHTNILSYAIEGSLAQRRNEV